MIVIFGPFSHTTHWEGDAFSYKCKRKCIQMPQKQVAITVLPHQRTRRAGAVAELARVQGSTNLRPKSGDFGYG